MVELKANVQVTGVEPVSDEGVRAELSRLADIIQDIHMSVDALENDLCDVLTPGEETTEAAKRSDEVPGNPQACALEDRIGKLAREARTIEGILASLISRIRV